MSRILAFAACGLMTRSAQPQASRIQTVSPASQRPHSLATVLADYSRLTGKTVLRSSWLPDELGSFPSDVSSETNASAALLESHLRESGILLIQNEPLFVRVVPVGWTNSAAAAFLATVKPPADKPDQPRGTANFAPADLEQVLKVYTKLRSRTLLRPRVLGSRRLHLQTVRDMTSQQLGYGITVLLALNGMAAVDDGDRFVQLVPMERWREVVTLAPKPLTNAPVLDPGQLPTFKPEPPPAALDRLNRLYLQVFHKQPPWTPKPVDKLVEFYAELSEQKATSSQIHGKLPVWFELTTPLTKEEILYAIETTLRLEGLAIAKPGDKPIGVIPLAEQQRLEKAKAAGPQGR